MNRLVSGLGVGWAICARLTAVGWTGDPAIHRGSRPVQNRVRSSRREDAGSRRRRRYPAEHDRAELVAGLTARR